MGYPLPSFGKASIQTNKPKDPLISLINEVKTRSTFEALDTTVGDVAEVSAQDGLCKIKIIQLQCLLN